MILFFLIIIIFLIIFNYPYIDNFFNLDSNTIEFTRLDGSLIKKVKVVASLSLYDQEVLNLFTKNNIIKINIPDNFTVRIIYKLKNESKSFSKTVNLLSGIYKISKLVENKQIFQIDITNNNEIINDSNDSNDLLVKDIDGNIIYSSPEMIPIDWDIIYTNFGYDDYYIFYPSTNILKTNYYLNYPKYKLYLPSKRIQKQKYYLISTKDKYYKNKIDFENSGHMLLDHPQRIIINKSKINQLQNNQHKKKK